MCVERVAGGMSDLFEMGDGVAKVLFRIVILSEDKTSGNLECERLEQTRGKLCDLWINN